jgi:hypothetical protein
MKVMTCLIVALVLAAGWARFAEAQTVTARRNLAFGKIAGDHDLSGTVTISPSGAKSTSGGIFNQGGTARAAQFRVTGSARREITIILPSSFTMKVNGKMIEVTNLTHDCGHPCTIAKNGRRDVNVGGKATLSANQGAGNYSGTFSFTVIYD